MRDSSSSPVSSSHGHAQGGATLRDVAKRLGVSHVTVWRALKGSPKISAALRSEIEKVAVKMGYRPNPAAAILARSRSAAGGKHIQAELGWLNFWPEPGRLRRFKEFDLYWKGAAACAEDFGYRLEEFRAKDRRSLERIEKVIQARGICGLLVAPGPLPTDWESFHWDRYSLVRLGRPTQGPSIHCVAADQMANTRMAFDAIRARGYKRIGFVGTSCWERFFGAGCHWAQVSAMDETLQRVPPLLFDPLPETKPGAHERRFHAWLRDTKPDAILADSLDLAGQLKRGGYRVPEDVALAVASVLDGNADAGIDQNPQEIGRVGVLQLISLINESAFGIPPIRREILIHGKWVDGNSLPRKS
jgi:LacI family transcriptional regulator